MLTDNQAKKLVVSRILRLQGCKDRDYIWHHLGVIRGILWTLKGKDPGDLSTTQEILEVLGVPFEVDPRSNEVYVSEDWLKENGL